MNRAKDIVYYHGLCNDGIASAFVHSRVGDNLLNSKYRQLIYGKIDVDAVVNSSKNRVVWFLDVCLKRADIIRVSEVAKKVIIIDHHKTAEEDLSDLNISNVEVVFDSSRSGCMLVYEYFENDVKDIVSKELLEYIEDRDLWKWELEDSEIINESIFGMITDYNDLFGFNEINRKFKENKRLFKEIGSVIINNKNKIVDRRCTENNVKFENICGVDFVVVNSTEFVSEVGNDLCRRYGVPSLMYAITNKGVNLSFRSANELADVSVIAKKFNGGGHRNAAGAVIDIKEALDNSIIG
jgi:oligoribonuclease NrnB/cAMP/cGMP phosphodiesterase (DHH superfamily)